LREHRGGGGRMTGTFAKMDQIVGYYELIHQRVLQTQLFV